MDSDKEVTWIVTRNTVKNRMIESSLIHRFSDSKTLQKSTQLLNKLLEKYRNLNRYQDYVKMKRLIKQKIHIDREIEDESFGEDDYSIIHKLNCLCKNNIKKPKDTISDKKYSLTSSIPNEITTTDVGLPKGSRKRLRMLRVNDKNDDEVPIKIKRSKNSVKQYLKNIEKKHPIINQNNSSNSIDINDMNTSLEKRINRTKVVLDTKDSNLLADNIRNNKQINNFAQNIVVMEDTINKPSKQTNHLQLSHKYPMEEEIHQDLTDTKNDEVVDHFENSNVNYIQEMLSHNTNDIIQSIESTSHDINADVLIKTQDEVTSTSNVMHDNMNLNDITNEKSKNDTSSSSSVVLQSQKSPPKVKSTEIINKRYKIINKENSYELPNECYNDIKFLESSTPLSFPKCEEEEELQEFEGYEDSISSSMLSQSEKRTRQLKMLNLDLENTSSSSEDEIQQKDNLNETTVLNSLPKVLRKNTTWNKLKLNRSHDTHHKEDKSFHSLQNISNSAKHQHDICNKDLTKHKTISPKNIKPKVQTIDERPCNLKNFLKNEQLVKDTNTSIFALPDFSKDEEIFLIDMPITVQLADLQGQRICLKNKLLKLGTSKYEIIYKDIPVQSCVFSTCKDSEPYKIINVKPKGSILVKRKLFPLPLPKYSKYNTKSYHKVHKHKSN